MVEHCVVCCCHVCGKLFEHKTFFMSTPIAFDVVTADGICWSLPCICCGNPACKAQLKTAWEDPKKTVWKQAQANAQENGKLYTLKKEHEGTAWQGHRLVPVTTSQGDCIQA